MPNALLARYFQGRGLFGDIDFSTIKETKPAELFQTSVPNINMHIKNIFDEGELRPDSVIKDFLITAADEG